MKWKVIPPICLEQEQIVKMTSLNTLRKEHKDKNNNNKIITKIHKNTPNKNNQLIPNTDIGNKLQTQAHINLHSNLHLRLPLGQPKKGSSAKDKATIDYFSKESNRLKNEQKRLSIL